MSSFSAVSKRIFASKYSLEALAEIYYVGIGVAEDEQKALPFIMKAAKAGLSASQRVLAHLYSKGKVV